MAAAALWLAIFGHLHHDVHVSENGQHHAQAGVIFGHIQPAHGAGLRAHVATADPTEDVMVGTKATKQNGHIYKRIQSPVGRLTLVASDRGLAAILWEHERPGRVRLNMVDEDSAHPMLVEAERQLEEYFEGRRQKFELKLDPSGTPFQQTVWSALMEIPFGETRTYGEIAARIGHPSAARAVGAANGRNPLSIVAPCHRVLGSTGALTGFAGGLEVKERLLAFEKNVSKPE